MDEKQTGSCYNCQSRDFVLLHEGCRDNQDIDVLQCKKCGLLFLSDFSQVNSTFYEDSGMTASMTLDAWIMNTEQDDKRRFLALNDKLKNKVVLDFGCGNAGFLNFVKSVCKKAYGVELQKAFQDYFKSCGLDVFSDIAELPEKVDYITMFHVLEHLKNPVEELKKLKEHLTDNGRVHIEVPNSKDALLSLYQCKSFADFVFWSCHLFVYNSAVLKNIAQKAGFKVLRIEYIQRYTLMNHLHWLFCNKPAGHKVWKNFDYRFLNKIYFAFLKLFKITDTIVIELKK